MTFDRAVVNHQKAADGIYQQLLLLLIIPQSLPNGEKASTPGHHCSTGSVNLALRQLEGAAAVNDPPLGS